ncbi:O-acyltransferase like protein-like [Culex pipiens pallens]|uniref:O-acyltransferase like protein-like n=1 Tax=Culex pipiens pallens TaxID=42434 RepID=UPI0022AA683A|nr:O-acyltransferase like protein-like [Culex pipiens pallens]
MLSVTVLSYGLGLVMFLLIEQPAANLLGTSVQTSRLEESPNPSCFYSLRTLVRSSASLLLEDNVKLPALYRYDNYDQCLAQGSTFCMVRAVVKPNSSNEVWNRIQSTYSNGRFYRHNLVERAICIERCLQIVNELSHSERQELLGEPFAVDFKYFLDAKFFPLQSHHRKLHGEVVNVCVNRELRSEFGLEAFAEIEYCHEPNRRVDPLDTWDVICIAVICLVIVFSILSTIFDYHLKKKLSLGDHFGTNLESIEHRLATVWSVPRNLRSMTAPPRSVLGKDFLCLEGVRFVTMFVVVVVHVAQMWMRIPLQNPELFEEAFQNSIFASVCQMTTNLVQLFFTIGGLLTAVNLLDFLAKNPGNIRSWWKVLWDKVVNRLKRLLPVYLFMILIVATLFRRIPIGPLYDRIVGAESSNCRTNWWINLLFVNNYVNGNDTCLRASWYLSADLQYYLFGIFALLMMTRFSKTTKYWIGFMVILNFAGPGLEIWFRQLPPLSTNAIRFSAPTFFDDEWMEKMYKPFQTSSAGYFYGIMAGMMYHQIKHSGKILESQKVRSAIAILAIVVTVACYAPAYLLYEANLKPLPWPMPIYGSVAKNICSIAAAVVFVNAALNEEGSFRNIMEHTCLVPLGKLSYTVYHINFVLVTALVVVVRETITLDASMLIGSTVGILVLSYGLGLVLFLLVEQPLANLLGSKTNYFRFAGKFSVKKAKGLSGCANQKNKSKK